MNRLKRCSFVTTSRSANSAMTGCSFEPWTYIFYLLLLPLLGAMFCVYIKYKLGQCDGVFGQYFHFHCFMDLWHMPADSSKDCGNHVQSLTVQLTDWSLAAVGFERRNYKLWLWDMRKYILVKLGLEQLYTALLYAWVYLCFGEIYCFLPWKQFIRGISWWSMSNAVQYICE